MTERIFAFDELQNKRQSMLYSRYLYILALFLACNVFWGASSSSYAQTSNPAQKPYLGWSSFSQQTISSNFLTQANVTTQSDALLSSGLQSHGFNYINMDSGWMGSFDGNGRPIPSPATFPDIVALVTHIHNNGQKAGIYWIPGIEQPAVDANSPILGTPYHIQDILVVPHVPGNSFSAGQNPPYHNKIDFTKPGAQEYVNSVVNLFASWGIDFIKLDGVTPGSYHDDLTIDNRAEVEAWSKAIAQSSRPIWLTVSWDLDEDYLSTWQQFANARRVEGDVECESNCSTITNWSMTSQRFYDLVGWQSASGTTVGWNDLDSLEVGNGSTSGLSGVEQQTAITLWAMANAPMYIGGDLTILDDAGKQLLTNDEVIAVDQSGHPAKQIIGGANQVWASNLGDGTYYVALFNLNAFPSPVSIQWSSLGFANAPQVRDLWSHIDMGSFGTGFSTVVMGHGARLLKVTASGQAPAPNSQSYEAEAATLSGSAQTSSCTACSGGEKVSFLGNGANNNVTFSNVSVRSAGTYLMQVDSMTIGPRSLLVSINGGPFTTMNLSGSSFALPSSTTIPVQLNAGLNSIQFGNPVSYASDLDRIVISGDGSAPPSTSNTYEAELATLGGTASATFCNSCSGVSKAGNIGGSGNDVTFTNVTAPTSGTYQMEVDYLTSGPRSFIVNVNNGSNIQLDLDGSSFSLPTSTVIAIPLNAGANTIHFSNPTGYAPDLDRIAIAPTVESANLTGAFTEKVGGQDTRIWKLTLANSGLHPALKTQTNGFMLTQTGGSWACTPKVQRRLPIEVGWIAPAGYKSTEIPIDFSHCADNARFSLHVVFSSNNGADVGSIVGVNESR